VGGFRAVDAESLFLNDHPRFGGSECRGESHGLVPWFVRFVATIAAWPVLESHGLVPWFVRFVATIAAWPVLESHGLVPWFVTLPARRPSVA
jgi:hypothetical protein